MKQKSSRWQTTQGRETTASGGEGKQERKKKKKERRESIPSVALNRTKGQQPLRGTDASFSWGSNVAETHDDEIKKKRKSPLLFIVFLLLLPGFSLSPSAPSFWGLISRANINRGKFIRSNYLSKHAVVFFFSSIFFFFSSFLFSTLNVIASVVEKYTVPIKLKKRNQGHNRMN